MVEKIDRLEEAVKRYEVNYTDENGATSPIDTVDAPASYTGEQYVRDCEKNADDSWVDMLHRGTVCVTEVEK